MSDNNCGLRHIPKFQIDINDNMLDISSKIENRNLSWDIGFEIEQLWPDIAHYKHILNKGVNMRARRRELLELHLEALLSYERILLNWIERHEK